MLDINDFGRKMMQMSGSLADDAQCNSFARVGDLLTRIGQARGPKSIYDLTDSDLTVISQAMEIFKKEKITS